MVFSCLLRTMNPTHNILQVGDTSSSCRLSTSIFGGPTHTNLKEMVIALLDWLIEQNAEMPHPLNQKVDFDNIILAGHSLGGKVAFLTATEDARVKGVMGIDPVDAQGGPFPRPEVDFPSVTPELMNFIAVPSIVVGETTNSSCEGTFCQGLCAGRQQFPSILSPRGV